MINTVVTGASGRMGQMLIASIQTDPKTQLLAVTEREGHDWVGQDLGAAMGTSSLNVPVVGSLSEVIDEADAVIDFTSPAASVAHAGLVANSNATLVIGTTGMTEGDLSAIKESAGTAKIVQAGNMSLGVNLLVQLTKKVAEALDEDFDIEVVEAHHRHKVDAPSGTALMLGEAAAEGRGLPLKDIEDRGRDGITGARKRGDIGFSAIRGGDVVGEHDVIFAADGERIVLRHLATDRRIFARGALKAAKWGQDQKPGLYNMLDVLGL